MFTGKMNVNPATAYQQSFGHLPHGTIMHEGMSGPLMTQTEAKAYMNPNAKIIYDAMNNGVAEFKAHATTAGGAGTAGQAMIPIYVDPIIVDRSRKYTPLREMMPRVTNQGITADFNVITAKGAAITAVEDAPLNEADDTENRESTSIKYLYSVGRVTGQMQAAQPSYVLAGWQATGSGLSGTTFSPASTPNAKQYEVIKKSRALMEKEEALIVNGDASTTATEFSGIVKLQSTTNKVDKNTTALTYDDVETAIQYAVDDSGRPNLAVAATSVLGDLRKIMIDTFNYRPADMTVQLPFGVSSHLVLETMNGPVPVLYSQSLSNTTAEKSIYFLDMNFWEMRVLQDQTYEDLAKTNDSQKFMLKIYEALICRAPSFNSWIGEISA